MIPTQKRPRPLAGGRRFGMQAGQTAPQSYQSHDPAQVLLARLEGVQARRDLRSMTPGQRSAMKQAARIPQWRAALDALAHEALVTLIAANRLSDGRELSAEDRQRLSVAALRIFDAREVLA